MRRNRPTGTAATVLKGRGLGIGAAGVIAAIIAIVLSLSRSQQSAADVLPPDEELRVALAAERFDFLPPADADWAEAIPPQRAVEVALDEFGQTNNYRVYLGRFTDPTQHVGDETTPLAIADRLTYGIQLFDLPLAVSVPPGQTPPKKHGELIVFVDALTGKFLMAVSFR